MKLLDLYCGGGGAGMGYHRAGFEVVGVDINPQPNYPFTFIQADALEYVAAHGHEYDAIHASPPCQQYSISTSFAKQKGATYSDLVTPTRELLDVTGKPYIIENVPGAPIRPDITLVGYIFGLKVIRRRLFELNFFCLQPIIPPKKGSVYAGDFVSVFGSGSWKPSNWSRKSQLKNGISTQILPAWRKKTIRETWAYAMGIDWHLTTKELSQSIPPAYTEFIGSELMRQLTCKP